jgi:hypothetical protein
MIALLCVLGPLVGAFLPPLAVLVKPLWFLPADLW